MGRQNLHISAKLGEKHDLGYTNYYNEKP